MEKDIDIIIYGATGFTGKLCVKYFQSLNTTVTWAIAGRNLIKLQKVAEDHQAKVEILLACLLYTSPSPRDGLLSRMPSSA